MPVLCVSTVHGEIGNTDHSYGNRNYMYLYVLVSAPHESNDSIRRILNSNMPR